MKISRINAMIEAQEGISGLTRESVERVQLTKLNALLERERSRGGFYKNLPERLGNLGELAQLPFTTDEELAANPGGLLLVSQGEVQRVLSDATSGTTGAAKRVFYTPRDCERTVELFEAGLGELIFPGSVTMVCFPFSGPFGLGDLIAEALSRLGARTVKAGAGRSYGELSELLEGERPDTFVGMPTQLLSMLRFCGRGSLERALVSGDACPPEVIRGCEELLGTRLFPHYGSREMGLGGAVCCQAHEGMHLRENNVIAEIVDEEGRVLPAGEYGELVITTIGMEAMPLIRYRTGDRTRIIPGVCPCGSEVIRLDSVERVVSSRIAALDGNIFAIPGVIDYMAKRVDGSLCLTVLTDGSVSEESIQSAAGEPVQLKLRRAEDKDIPLYMGKRTLL